MLTPYWLRHLRSLPMHDPFYRAFQDVFTRDPFFLDPVKYMKAVVTPLERFDGVNFNSEVKVDPKKVEVHLDVQNFTPDQINVKTVGNEISVEGRKEIKRKDGWTRSHFERKFLLPEGFPPERVECHLDKGKLVLVAFRSEPVAEREVPIKITENTKTEQKEAEITEAADTQMNKKKLEMNSVEQKA